MRVLLDEQPPRQLARHLAGHDVRTVQQQSWAGLKNGALLQAAEAAAFSVLVTGDQNLEHQQNLTTRALGVVVSARQAVRLKTSAPGGSCPSRDRPRTTGAGDSGHGVKLPTRASFYTARPECLSAPGDSEESTSLASDNPGTIQFRLSVLMQRCRLRRQPQDLAANRERATIRRSARNDILIPLVD